VCGPSVGHVYSSELSFDVGHGWALPTQESEAENGYLYSSRGSKPKRVLTNVEVLRTMSQWRLQTVIVT